MSFPNNPQLALVAAVAAALTLLGAIQTAWRTRRATVADRPRLRIAVNPHAGRTVRIDLLNGGRSSGPPWRVVRIAARSPRGAHLRKAPGGAGARGAATDRLEVDFPIDLSGDRCAPRVFLELPDGPPPKRVEIGVECGRETGEVFAKAYRVALPPRLYHI